MPEYPGDGRYVLALGTVASKIINETRLKNQASRIKNTISEANIVTIY
jgi:hypothetical protein